MVTVPVDDRDPSVIYSRHWSQLNSSLAYQNTITWTGVVEATAQISFVGSSIEVYGTTFAKVDGVVASECLYSIDGGTPVRLTVNESETGSTQWRQLLFQSPVLPEASHVLTIEYNSNQTNSVLFLDFFLVNKAILPSSSLTTSSSSPTTASTSSTTSQSSLSSPSSSFSATQGSSSSSPTSGATPGVATVLVQGKSKSELPIGSIVGGALGAFTLIFICIVLLYLLRRRREGHSNENIGAPPLAIGWETRLGQISPYDISQPPRQQQPRHGGGEKPVFGTETPMATLTSSGLVQHSSEQAPAVATASFLLGNITRSDNLVSLGALPNTSSISGDPANGLPPSYREPI